MSRITATLLLALLLIPSGLAARTPDIDVQLKSYSPQPVQPGQTMDVIIEMTNTGDPAQEVTLELLDDYPFTVEETYDAERARSFGPLRNTQTFQFRVSIADDAPDGLTPLSVRYSVDGGASIEEEFTIDVETFDARAEIVRVEQEPERLAPGQRGTLTLTLRNGADTPLRNVDVIMDYTQSYDANANMENMLAVQAMINARLEEVNRRVAAGQSPLKGATPMGMSKQEGGESAFRALAPVGMADQQSIGSLRAGETVTLTFPVQALPDAEPGVHAVPVYINYNDEENNPFHVAAQVPVTVDMAPDIYVSLKESSLRTTDFAGTVTFSVANRGLTPAQFVTVDLVEENYSIITAPTSLYLGTLAPGEEKTATFTILPEHEELELPVKLEYRDAFNEAHEEEHLLGHTIVNRNYYRDMPYEMMAAWGVLGLVILVLTGFYLSHLRKRNAV